MESRLSRCPLEINNPSTDNLVIDSGVIPDSTEAVGDGAGLLTAICRANFGLITVAKDNLGIEWDLNSVEPLANGLETKLWRPGQSTVGRDGCIERNLIALREFDGSFRPQELAVDGRGLLNRRDRGDRCVRRNSDGVGNWIVGVLCVMDQEDRDEGNGENRYGDQPSIVHTDSLIHVIR
jgi:hypothetical protein